MKTENKNKKLFENAPLRDACSQNIPKKEKTPFPKKQCTVLKNEKPETSISSIKRQNQETTRSLKEVEKREKKIKKDIR